jgi:hypothetical protein
VNAIDQYHQNMLDPQHPWDRVTTMQMMDIGRHFRMLEGIPPGEINAMYHMVEHQVAYEAYARAQNIEDHEAYSMRPRELHLFLDTKRKP